MLKSLWNKLTLREPYIEDSLIIDDVDKFNWDEEVDLVVAGFGGAGAAAAIEAHDQGLTPLVLDRFAGGGATAISGGIFYAGGGTSVQKQAGVEDSPENMFNYLKQEVQGAVSDKTLKRFCDESVDNYDWMVNNGVPFEASFCPFKTSYPPNNYYFYYSGNESFPPYSDHATPAARGHRAKQKGVSGAAIFYPLKASAERKGIRIQKQSKVVSLAKNADGEVVGLKAIKMTGLFSKPLHAFLGWLHVVLRYGALFIPQLFQFFALLTELLERNFGESVYIRSRKGVIMATGGFYSNQQMIEQHAPEFRGGSPLGTLADDGAGIKMAQDAGGSTDLMDRVSAWRFINPPLSFVKGILVGPSGKRVCNEMLYGAQVGERMMRDHDGKAWVIMDEATYKSTPKDLNLKKGLWFHVMLGYFYMWFDCKKANSIRGLAAKLKIDQDALQETIDNYNTIAKSDEPDPEGKPKNQVIPIENGPFYAVNASYHYFFVPCASLTLGGLRVNEESGLVLDAEGKEIPGLYAAGRTAVGVPSRGYVSGLSIADCIFSGRRAARHIAQQ